MSSGPRLRVCITRALFALGITGLFGSAATQIAHAAAFTPGNIVVYRVGTGSNSLVNTGNEVFLDEYTPTGTLVQSIALPTTTSGANHRLIASGTATSEGLLTRSTDGQYLLLTGYDAPIPTSGLAGTSSSTVPRVVARVDASGAINTATALTDFSTGNNPRSAVSTNGTDVWVAGGAGGARYTTVGTTTSNQLSTTVTNLRQLQIFDGQLYTSSASGTLRVGSIGSGTPTTSGQIITNLPGFPTTGSPYGFFLADLSPSVPGVDTLYVADDGAPGLITKYSLVSGAWTANGSITASGVRGLTATASGTNVVLYATTGGSSGGGGGSLYTFTDSTGYNAAISGAATVIATAGANQSFRGVALAPGTAAPQAPSIVAGTPADQSVNAGSSATLTVSATGTSPLSYQWYQGTAPDASTPVGTNSPSFTTSALNSTTQYWVRVSNAVGSADSRTATVTVAVTNEPPSISPIPPLSGVISDPTNPGASFSVSDAETPADSLVVSATATTNTTVAPLANISIVSGGGGQRTISVNPAGVGYADITVAVSDGTNSASTILHYAGSAASGTPATSHFLTGTSDASTAQALDATFMLVGDDENQGLRLYRRDTSGAPINTFDFTSSLGFTDSAHPEVDIEASARTGNRIYWLGSQSNSASGASRPNRQRLFATDVAGSGASTTLTYVGRYDGLRTDLINWDHNNLHGLGADHYGLQASATIGVPPEASDGSGFNIEGLEFAPGSPTTAYISFRAPLAPATSRTLALLVPLTNIDSLVGGNPAAGPATFGAPIELDLGGRGVREIRKNSFDEYVISAGPASDAGAFDLYTWDGNPTHAPVRRAADLASATQNGSVESIVEVPHPLTNTTPIQVIQDDGDTVYYGDGIAAKDLGQPAFKKFRTDTVQIGAPIAAVSRIHDIQGAAQKSPVVGQVVQNVPGIVTAKRSNGFYLQDPNPDADPATSEGIFVFTSSAPGTVAVGDSVLVSGTVSEFPGTGSSAATNLTVTEIDSPSISVVSHGNALPAPVMIGTGGRVPPTQVIEDDATGCSTGSGDATQCDVFDPANDGLDFFESLEGMLVQVNTPLVTGPTNSFGEVWVLGDGGANSGPGVRTGRGGIVLTDDGTATNFNPERILLDDEITKSSFSGCTISGFTTGTPCLNVGDTLESTTGVLDYGFGNFRIQVLAPVVKSSGALAKEVSATPSVNQLAIATFNMENLSPLDGATKINGLAGLIVSNLRSPDIVAVEEIQDNNGDTERYGSGADNGVVDASQTYAALIGAIQSAGGPTYQYRQIDPVNDKDGGSPGGNIRQGFLFRADRGLAFVDRPGGTSTAAVSVVDASGVPQLSFSPGRIDPGNSAWNSSRKPLAAEFTFNGQTLFVVGNHFNSKGGDQPLYGKFQPPTHVSEDQRHQQATLVHNFVDQILGIDPNANVVVLGDLNDFEFSCTGGILKGTLNPDCSPSSGPQTLHYLIESLPQSERYSYVFEGNSQAIDHTVVSNHLFSSVPFEYDIVHVNSEFAVQASDHEPQVTRFTLPPLALGPCSALVYPDRSATLTSEAGDITITIPAGAVPAPTIVTCTPATTTGAGHPLDATQLHVGPAFSIDFVDAATGTPVHQLAASYSVAVTYSDAALAALGLTPGEIALYFWDGSAWSAITDNTLDSANHTLTSRLDHATDFDVIGVPVGPGGGCPPDCGGGGPGATPELDSLVLFGAGASGLLAYARVRIRGTRRRRHRSVS